MIHVSRQRRGAETHQLSHVCLGRSIPEAGMSATRQPLSSLARFHSRRKSYMGLQLFDLRLIKVRFSVK